MVIATKHQKVIDSLKERVLAGFADEVHSSIRFGSVARGDAKADSDIDILIISDMLSQSLRDRMESTYSPDAEITSAEAQEVVDDARQFLAKVRSFLNF